MVMPHKAKAARSKSPHHALDVINEVDWSLKTAQMHTKGIKHLLDRNRSVRLIAKLLEKKQREGESLLRC